MKVALRDFAVALALGCGASVTAEAQVAVQQPVVGGFGVSTTVSVPDRGSVRLGGVGTAASGRTSSGIFRPGTSSGLERSASSLSTSVYIHDLQAMDEALLAGAVGRANDPWTPRLNERRAAEPVATKATPREDTTGKAARYEQLAREAEAKGKPAIARMHGQMAAKFGSPVAQQKLTALAAR
ncbi:MAG TPA: hypothetical protein VFG20_16920 [Planctomycetaceae bacterium]|nr:hypothetical protein [Planctomycetaceae bacterium]